MTNDIDVALHSLQFTWTSTRVQSLYHISLSKEYFSSFVYDRATRADTDNH
jgi:hypothetical protein